VLGLAEISASDCKKLVCRLCKKDLCCDLTRGRRIWRGAYRSLVLCRVGFLGSVHVRILTKDNKEEEELVDVAPHWGEPRISYVMVSLCD
jgi:hypothetical protein